MRFNSYNLKEIIKHKINTQPPLIRLAKDPPNQIISQINPQIHKITKI